MSRNIKLLLCFIIVASVSACSRYHVPPGGIVIASENPRKTLAIPETSTAKTVAAKFIAAYDTSYTHEKEAGAARELTRAGMTLIDMRCDLFFQQIGRGSQDTDFGRRQFQAVSGTLVAALGVAGVSANAITGVGLGSALGVQTIDNYSAVYFFSPDVSAVQELVRRALGSVRETALAPTNSPQDFDAAIGVLRVYQNVCSAHEIKRLVTAAINKGETIATYGDLDAPKFSAAVERALETMARELSTPTLTIETVSMREAILIEMLVTDQPKLDKVMVDYVCHALSDALQNRVCTKASETMSGLTVETLVVQPPAADVQTKLRTDWATLRALRGAQYETDVQKQLAVLKDNAPQFRAAVAAKAVAADAEARANDADARRVAAERQAEAERKKVEALVASKTEAVSEANKATLSVGVK